jgi:hypothetical protein
VTASQSILDPIDGIVIGASAGGVEALSTILPALPIGLRAAVFEIRSRSNRARYILRRPIIIYCWIGGRSLHYRPTISSTSRAHRSMCSSNRPPMCMVNGCWALY